MNWFSSITFFLFLLFRFFSQYGDFFLTSPKWRAHIWQKKKITSRIRYTYDGHVLLTSLDALDHWFCMPAILVAPRWTLVVLWHENCSSSVSFWSSKVTFLRNLQQMYCKLLKNVNLGAQKGTDKLKFSSHTIPNINHRTTKVAGIQSWWLGTSNGWVVHICDGSIGSYIHSNIFVIYGQNIEIFWWRSKKYTYIYT